MTAESQPEDLYLHVAADEEHQDWQQIFGSSVLYWQHAERPTGFICGADLNPNVFSDGNHRLKKEKQAFLRWKAARQCVSVRNNAWAHTWKQMQPESSPMFARSGPSAGSPWGAALYFMHTHTHLLLRLNSSVLQQKCGQSQREEHSHHNSRASSSTTPSMTNVFSSATAAAYISDRCSCFH